MSRIFTIYTICKIKSRICNAIGLNPAGRETRLMGNPFISWPAPAAPGNQKPNPGNLENRENPARMFKICRLGFDFPLTFLFIHVILSL